MLVRDKSDRVTEIMLQMQADLQEERKLAAESRLQAAKVAEESKLQAAKVAEESKLQAAKVAEESKLALAELKTETAYLRSKVDKIAEQTIQIHDRVVGRFSSMTASTKIDLETAILDVLDDPEICEEVYAAIDEEIEFQERTKAYKADYSLPVPAKRKKGAIKDRIKAAAIYRAEVPNATRGELNSVGNWVSAVMGEIFGKPLHGAYVCCLEPIVNTLILYYVYERENVGRLY
jgi:hypothetical protein